MSKDGTHGAVYQGKERIWGIFSTTYGESPQLLGGDWGKKC